MTTAKPRKRARHGMGGRQGRSHVLTVRITPEQNAALARLAADSGRTKSGYVYWLVRQTIDNLRG